MKDYSLTKEEKKDYITKVEKQRNGKLKITYANGKVCKNVNFTSDLINKIEKKQEEQVKFALKKYKKTEKNGINYVNLAVGSYLGSCGAVAVSQVATHGLTSASSATIAMLLGYAGAYCVTRKIISKKEEKLVNQKEEELNKLRYRNDHEDELKRLREYRNALVGIKEKKRRQIESRNNPFSVLYVDDYSENDLRTIVANINQEDNKEKVKSR